VLVERAPDEGGRVRGEIRLVGGGDPTLGVDNAQGLDWLADQVAAAGVRRIEGDVVGDDTAYVWEPYPQGWEQDDTILDYGAPVSALTVNGNAVALRLRATGTTASVFVIPPVEYYAIDNRVRAGPGPQEGVKLERLVGSRQVRLWGSMTAPSQVGRTIAIDEPALYAAIAFRDALTRRGIAITGRPVARHRYANQAAGNAEQLGTEAAQPAWGVELARRDSPPLIELLRDMEKKSLNLYAELVLREAARSPRDVVSLRVALEALRGFLAEAGVTEDEVRLSDGSGLSGRNLTSPGAMVKLLLQMHQSERRDAWMSLLPIGGEEGTLADRFSGRALARRIHAKTGTLNHASALSGYAVSRSRGTVVFSIFVNNYNCPAAEIRRVIDRIALTLAE
jgi:D-alanyl-D-alanine carboxypeptidase/D-alanyl-D-alanine-endopeptidase (penicillin-binding protein 4)